MQREIKFRAWSPQFNELSNNFDLGGYPIFKNEKTQPYWSRGMCTLMQFTGLKDKNGKEIYEGDIINHKWDKKSKSGGYICGTYNFYPENACKVYFRNGSFYVEGSHNGVLYEEINFNHNSLGWVVVGNIFENPELLNK